MSVRWDIPNIVIPGTTLQPRELQPHLHAVQTFCLVSQRTAGLQVGLFQRVDWLKGFTEAKYEINANHCELSLLAGNKQTGHLN